MRTAPEYSQARQRPLAVGGKEPGENAPVKEPPGGRPEPKEPPAPGPIDKPPAPPTPPPAKVTI